MSARHAVGELLVLDHAQTTAALSTPDLTGKVRSALVAISRGTDSAPPRVVAQSPSGLLGAMPGYVPGLGLAAKLVTVFNGVTAEGHSAHRGLVAYFDAEDGRPLALMDAEVITAFRTAATATVAMLSLSASRARQVSIIGTGSQAAAQLAALDGLPTDRVPDRVLIGGRDISRAQALAARCSRARATTVETAVRSTDVVFCCTSSRTPVLRREWLADGTHVSSVGGSDGPELDAETVSDGAVFAEWLGAATALPPAGSWELQQIDPSSVTPLGQVLDGQHPGRRTAEEITVFKSTGHAALDVAAAAVVYTNARRSGLGVLVDI